MGPLTELSLSVISYLPAMAISSVCARWCSFARSLPSLWSKLKVEICTSSKEAGSPSSLTATLQHYLELLGQYPLTLALTFRGVSNRQDHSALVHLTNQAHRWKSFKYN